MTGLKVPYLVKSDNKLKFKFFFSEVTYDTIIPLD